MGATIRLGKTNVTATIEKYVWSSSNKDVENWLNGLLKSRSASGSDPNPDCSAARDVISLYGGTLLNCTKLEFDPDKIY